MIRQNRQENDFHWLFATVFYQQIENGERANQIHRFTIDHGKFILKENRKQCELFNFLVTFHISSGFQLKNREHFCIFRMESKLMALAIIMTKDMSARKCKCNE